MPKPKPGAKARSLGRELRQLRRDVKVSMKFVADETGWSESKVSRIETGVNNVSTEDVATLLAIYKVTGSTRDKLINRAKTIDDSGWWEGALKGVPSESIALADAEVEAVALTNWAPLLVPGLLQTMDYTRAYMLADGVADQDIGARIMARQRRQETTLGKINYTAYLDERVLGQRVGGRKVLLTQLRHLADVARLDRVTLQVIPSDSDAHSGLIGPFLMIDFDHLPSVVHVELRRSAVVMDGKADTDPYLESRNHLAAIAMDATHSLQCVERRINALESESHDDTQLAQVQ